jgi:hypothetical protein
MINGKWQMIYGKSRVFPASCSQVAPGCYHVRVSPLKKIILTSFILVSLLVCPSAGFCNRVGKSKSEPSSVSSAATLTRSYALTSFHGQRTASDRSKQNRARHPVITAVLLPGKLLVPNAASLRRLACREQQVLHLSARFRRPIGRGPPPSA